MGVSHRQQLLDAFANREIVHAYQPIIQFAGFKVVHVEALARWIRPGIGEIGPTSFLPLLHGSGLSNELTTYTADLALADLPRLRELLGAEVSVALNLSHRQLLDPHHTVDLIEAALDRSGQSPTALNIELVEDLETRAITATTEALARLRSEGVRIFLDDFGTSASSLTHLTEMTYDGIKIDRSFVAGLTRSTRARSVVEAVVTFASNTGIPVVAEGIETALQYRTLEELGCDHGQGFLLQRPRQVADLGPISAIADVAPIEPIQTLIGGDSDGLRSQVLALDPRSLARATEFPQLADALEAEAVALGADGDLLRCEINRRRILHAIYTNDHDGVRSTALQTSNLAERIGAWGYSAEALAIIAANNLDGADRDSGLRIDCLMQALELRVTKSMAEPGLSTVDNAIGASFASLGLWSRAGAWWQATVERPGSQLHSGGAIAAVNLVELELGVLEGDAWFVSDTPADLRQDLVERTIELLQANPHAPEGVVESFSCRLHLLSGDPERARQAIAALGPSTTILGQFLGCRARARLARVEGDTDSFLKFASRQVEILEGHALLSHHEQLAKRLLAEAYLTAGHAEKAAALLFDSNSQQFFADERRLKSMFNWIRLHADLNTHVSELFEVSVRDIDEQQEPR